LRVEPRPVSFSPANLSPSELLNPSSPKFKALIFDVGDILYDASVWRKWLTEELAGTYGKSVTYPQLVEAWEAQLVDVYKGRAEYWDRFTALMHQFGLSEDQVTQIEASAREKGKSVQVDRQPMPEVPETLAKLQTGAVKLIALSDSESGEAGIRKNLNQLGIEQYFDAVVSSFAIGHVKPEPEAFDYAIAQSGCTKAECGFVAHDIDELEGAQAHDLFAIGYNYHPDAPADAYVESFSELLTLVSLR